MLKGGDLFFWAGAITFNVLVAVVPLLLLVAGLFGFFLSARFGHATPELLVLVVSFLPQVNGEVELAESVLRLLEGLIEERTGFSILGALVLLWISTRLVASLRIVLREVFELDHDRGIVRGKLFDVHVILLGGVLLFLNIGLTLGARAVQAFGDELPMMDTAPGLLLQTVFGYLVTFGSAWVLFFLLYWYLPARPILKTSAAVGATFAAAAFELMKEGFTWYATSVADYSSAYGSLAVVAILFFWIYYSAVVFILGGQVARVHELRRGRKMTDSNSGSKVSGDGKRRAGTALIFTLILALPLAVSAQTNGGDGGYGGAVASPFGGNGSHSGFLNGGGDLVMASSLLERNLSLDRPLVEHDGPYVIVHLAENRVLVLEGTDVVWSAPAGTGHGFQLEGQGREWTFTTPIGMFQVLRKEKDPVWIAPEWYYVQRGLPIPAQRDRARIEGTLGTSAIFLGDGIAIHGTDRPELLMNADPEARRVSHGCIRLTNEAARELYHRVEVGTPVLIY